MKSNNQKFNMKKFIFFSIISLLTSSCSVSSNVKNDWDCGAPTGVGCIDITKADEMAVHRLNASKENRIKEIWFAPFTDNAGNLHEASVVKLEGNK